MKAAIAAAVPGAPHETLLVVEASVGRNAAQQARTWREYVGVSGLAVTKMDGTARGLDADMCWWFDYYDHMCSLKKESPERH